MVNLGNDGTTVVLAGFADPNSLGTAADPATFGCTNAVYLHSDPARGLNTTYVWNTYLSTPAYVARP